MPECQLLIPVKLVHFRPELLVHFAPESLVHFTPELVVHYSPDYTRLIRKWLRAPILINGKLVKRRKGVPQGSPLSPLLSNIMLNELDKEMKRQGLRYVRYADDFSVYTKSESTARKIGNNLFLFLKSKLKLPINREKSGIRKPVNFKVLGYGFVPTYRKGEKGKYQLVASEKSWNRPKGDHEHL